MKCDRCGKGVQVGMKVSHSHIRTKKRSYPNLHKFTIGIGGAKRHLRLCTKCLRIVKKQQVATSAKKVEKPLVVEAPKTTEEKTTLSEDIEKAVGDKSKEATKPQREVEAQKAATTGKTANTRDNNKTESKKTNKRQKKAIEDR